MSGTHWHIFSTCPYEDTIIYYSIAHTITTDKCPNTRLVIILINIMYIYVPWSNFLALEMKRSLFTLSIHADEARPFRRNGFDYVALPSGEEYAVELHNNHSTRCDVELYIDGTHVGGFVIQAHESITVERPEGVKRRFTFFNESSDVARSVSAIFKPQKHILYTTSKQVPRASMLSSEARLSAQPKEQYNAGVTVLGDRSRQTFTEVKSLLDSEIDWPLSTEVSLRLVVDNEHKYVPLSHSYPPRLDSY